jgi:hypothetical protein
LLLPQLAVESHHNWTVLAPIKTTTRSDIDVGARLSSLQNLPPQFVENDRSPLMGATGSPIRAGLHTYKEPKTLSLLFHGSSTSLTAVLFSGDLSTESNDIIGLGRPAT